MTQGAAVGIFPAGSAGLVQARYKESDQSKTNDNTLANDAALAGIPLVADGRYIIEARIIALCLLSAIPDIKWKFDGPGTSATFFSFGIVNSTAMNGGSAPHSSTPVTNLPAGVAQYLHILGAWEPTASGNLNFQWAQNSSNANAVLVAESSWLKVTQVP